MKKIIKYRLHIALAICIAFVFTSCDLEPQDKFRFNPETVPQYTFGEKTPWEWLKTNPNDEFSLMIQAVELSDLVEEYSNKTDKRTYFLIKDEGFTKFNGILKREFGSDTLELTEVDPVKLRKILMYHILPQYVDQGPDNLLTLDFNYSFPTLTKDLGNPNMTINRDWNYVMQLNQDPNLGTGSKLTTDVKLHNYIFSNGNSVAHLTEGYARVEPFED
ncbi:fasciclin domain-containing protein [Formosa sp. PL04]|uniref:fasciclin domain-containing protein n=1 Tax=Formosa sp. PL04 TaxID=3081755 RepID=UPI002980C08F|nr:fasciclin domain-containing protein [Formosa sp. PL04]MDW5288145.1 fasciclin domain-containing protein [Formosa sp. PL04]